jgi:hypothetical protein
MARTVWGAFNEFRRDVVDLDPEQAKTARASRDYLYEQMKWLERNYGTFPRSYKFVPYGSFSRKTKIRPLDDIDFLVVLDGTGVYESQNGYTSYLVLQDAASNFAPFKDDIGCVSSIRVLNRIRSGLESVGNYRKAEVRRNQEVVSLTLSSHPWTFDIAPAIEIVDRWSRGTLYYLIPNGSGHWKRTNPDKDQEFITRVNQRHGGDFIPLLRLLKFWNNRTYKRVLGSYYFETLALRAFEYAYGFEDFQRGIKFFFDNGPAQLMSSCPDPKGLGPNLDADIGYETKVSVRDKMREVAELAGNALYYERGGNHEYAIGYWRDVFGGDFPTYGW